MNRPVSAKMVGQTVVPAVTNEHLKVTLISRVAGLPAHGDKWLDNEWHCIRSDQAFVLGRKKGSLRGRAVVSALPRGSHLETDRPESMALT